MTEIETIDVNLDRTPQETDTPEQLGLWIMQLDRTQAVYCWRAGWAYIYAKAKLEHGEWLRWRETYSPHRSNTTVSRYMRLARRFTEEQLQDIGLTEAYRMMGVVRRTKPNSLGQQSDLGAAQQPHVADEHAVESAQNPPHDGKAEAFEANLFRPEQPAETHTNVAEAHQDGDHGSEQEQGVSSAPAPEAQNDAHGAEPPPPVSGTGQDDAAQPPDILTALTQVVNRLDYLYRTMDRVEDAATLVQLADKAVELIHRIRAKVV